MEIINKNISRNYKVEDRFEVGMILIGPEVKSVKAGKVTFKGAFCSFGEGSGKGTVPLRKGTVPFALYLKNFYIAPYPPAKREQQLYDPYRPRKLLLKKNELNAIRGKLQAPGITMVPLRIYTKNRFVKLEIGIAKGLKKYDKREKIKKQEFERKKRLIIGY